jgi:thiamine pyrophosphate-dependent acetolactate synthase large subunit-like protein
MGDAGMGNAGFDIETALRFELPIVYVVTNNDGWLTGMRSHYYGKNWDVLGEQDRRYGQEFLPGIRYENLSQVFGTHGEYVDDPAALRPALERALRAAEGGKTAIVNVRVDKTLINPATYNFGYAYCWAHIPWDELPKRGKAIRRVYYTHLPWDQAGEPPMEPPDPWEPLTEEEMVP